MSENYKDDEWGPQQFRIYADNQIQQIDREVEEQSAMAQGLARHVFQADAMGRDLLKLSEPFQGHFDDVVDSLKSAPYRLGALQGTWFLNVGMSQEVKDDAQRLAVVLQRHRDLLIVRERYERLNAQAIEAERAPRAERADAIQQLRLERQYCDVSRETRDIENRDRLERDWPKSPEPERGGGGGSPPAGGQGGGPAGGSSSRSWWRGEAKEQDPVREERREPEAAQRRWWREEKPTQEEEPEREREPDREDDRFKR